MTRTIRPAALRPLRLPLLLAAATLAVPGAAQPQVQRPFVVVETGADYGRLQDAVDAIGEGQGTIRIADGTYRQCAVQRGGQVRFQAARPGGAVFDGVACDGKATLVLRGRGATVTGLVFQNIAVPDANGAGIRLESGDLVVRETLFRDSEQGILSGDVPGVTLTVEQSTFSGLGRCDRGLSCAHSLYTGKLARLVVTRTRFERGRGGHYLKTRTGDVAIVDNSFDDTAGKGTNYHIDLSAGATGRITDNLFVQGGDKENRSALITVAPEARDNRSAGLVITGNRAMLAPGVRAGTTFVADWSGEDVRPGANRLGEGISPYEAR